jgi:hypothetical protein
MESAPVGCHFGFQGSSAARRIVLGWTSIVKAGEKQSRHCDSFVSSTERQRIYSSEKQDRQKKKTECDGCDDHPLMGNHQT